MEIENSTNNLVNTLTEMIPESFTPDAAAETVETTSSFFPKLILIIILLTVVGGVVFIYLAKGDKSFTEFVTPYLNYIGIDVGKYKNVTDNTDYGITGETGPYAHDTTIDTTTKIDITTTAPSKTLSDKTTKKDDSAVECENPKKENLIKALNNAAQTEEYMADDASSSIQSINKSKWCFIGEEKSVRNCVLLNDAQKCMSGDIFPSKDICINPNMRT